MSVVADHDSPRGDDDAITDISAAKQETTYSPGQTVNLSLTVGALQRGTRDPTMAVDRNVIWRAQRTPGGIATLALRRGPLGEIHATAWGPGSAHALEQVPRLCGADDDDTGFDASLHPLIADSARRNAGLRLPRTDQVFDALACAILEQKVTGLQAFRAWRALVTEFGERAPGPTPRPMFAAPSPERWRAIPSWSWHKAGVEPPQSKTIVRAAARASSVSRAVLNAAGGDARERVLTSLPGVGPWTSAETRITATGDPDAVSVGDFHLANVVGFALTGSRTDDAGMLELLAPWAGQRQRVIRLIWHSGMKEPRRGPRLAPEDHRRR